MKAHGNQQEGTCLWGKQAGLIALEGGFPIGEWLEQRDSNSPFLIRALDADPYLFLYCGLAPPVVIAVFPFLLSTL